ncbi:protein JINGUBANG-like [Spinacia oleracea]|uniref:Protein JINGUBANG-like n=1 Tax=Spinacia oleracea TaxID=3562 RepID=A0A9R0IQ44_SPIOL|nr:protein JINGUBANG-like [Spinacia oleracea]
MKRQFSTKKSLSILLDEDNNNNNNNKIEDQSPSFHHLSLNLQHNESPESLWSRSPISSPCNPSLLYCCISSLRHDGDVYSIAVSGDLVLTGSSSRRVHAWYSLDCHSKGCLQASSGDVRAMAAQGNMLFTSHKDHKVRIWNMKSNNNDFKPKKLTTLPISNNFKNFILRPITPQHKDIISCMAYYNIEGLLYTGSFDKTVKVWRLNERKCIDSFVAHADNINDMVINQQNGYLFTCSSDGTVKMWMRVYGETSHVLIKVLCVNKYPIYALALSNTSMLLQSQNQISSFLYSGCFDGCISFWEQEVSCQYNMGSRSLQGHQFAVLCLVALENLVISGSEDSTIRIWRRSEETRVACTHECIAVLEGHRGPVKCLAALSCKDKSVVSFLVFSASLDQTFKVWRVKLLQEMKNSSADYCCINENDDDDMEVRNTRKSMEVERSTVLSPSWVRRKLHCRSIR